MKRLAVKTMADVKLYKVPLSIVSSITGKTRVLIHHQIRRMFCSLRNQAMPSLLLEIPPTKRLPDTVRLTESPPMTILPRA